MADATPAPTGLCSGTYVGKFKNHGEAVSLVVTDSSSMTLVYGETNSAAPMNFEATGSCVVSDDGTKATIQFTPE